MKQIAFNALSFYARALGMAIAHKDRSIQPIIKARIGRITKRFFRS
jgi:hypothetical protein